jgi:NAD(P)H-dependent nitrite reductase small subunit
VPVGAASDFAADAGKTILHGDVQVAVFHFASRGEWYATQNLCPHKRDMVLARGLLGSVGDEPKVACPLHKKTFSLESGKGLSDPQYRITTFPVENRDGEIWLKLPRAEKLRTLAACRGSAQ